MDRQDHELVLDGVLMREVIERDRTELIEASVRAVAAELPALSVPPTPQLLEDMARSADLGLELFLAAIAPTAVPTDHLLAEIGEHAGRRAEDGIPLTMVLQAFNVATAAISEYLGQLVRAEEIADFMLAFKASSRLVNQVFKVATEGYLDVYAVMLDLQMADSTARLHQLLQGTGTVTEADRDLPYLVIGLTLRPTHQQVPLASEQNTAEARRALHRLRAAIVAAYPMGLCQLTINGGLLVIPVPTRDVPAAWTHAEGLVADWTTVSGLEVRATGVTAATPSGVGEAEAMVRELRGLVGSLGRGPGLYRLEDVALEYQLTRPGPARDLLAGSVDPIMDKPELLETLTTYLRLGADRRAASEALFVHPNTVDYRLRKCASLLGIDPTDGRSTTRLAVALWAHESARGTVDGTI